jgi:hypothetical protein
MFEDLEHYLGTIVGDVRVTTALSILNKISTLTGPDAPVAFSQYSLGVPDDVDNMEEIARFDDALENIILASLGELGITLDGEIFNSGHFPTIERLLFALERVALWQDADRLLAILVDNDDREAAIAELAAEINGDEESQYAELLKVVSKDFYDNLIDVVQSNAEADAVEIMRAFTVDHTQIKAHFQGRDQSFVSGIIRDNTLTFGLDYPFYLKFYENYLWDLEPDELVQALVDFAVCSNAPVATVGKLSLAAVANYAETPDQAQRYRGLMVRHLATLPETYREAPSLETD